MRWKNKFKNLTKDKAIHPSIHPFIPLSGVMKGAGVDLQRSTGERWGHLDKSPVHQRAKLKM